MEAVETMPHGWIWKLFHHDLWMKIKTSPEYSYLFTRESKEMANNNNLEKVESEVLTPTVIKQTTLPYIQD